MGRPAADSIAAVWHVSGLQDRADLGFRKRDAYVLNAVLGGYWHMHIDQAEVISFVVGLIVGYLLRGRYPNILHR